MTTNYYPQRFDNVEGYLHHRKPYLLIEEIVSVEPQAIRTRSTISEDAFFIQGHFPGAPILPGAMMQEMSTQSAGILIASHYNPMPEYNTEDPFFNKYAIGVLVKIKQAKYRGFARPGNTLDITVKLDETVGQLFDFSCTIQVAEKTIMRNKFQLANILSTTLQGKE